MGHRVVPEGGHRPIFRSKNARMMAVVAVTMSAATYAGVVASQAVATGPSTGGYEIDGNLTPSGGTDWAGSLSSWTRDASGCHSTLASPPALPKLICDPVKTDATTFPGGAKESDPAGWVPLQSSQVTPKTDISNVY